MRQAPVRQHGMAACHYLRGFPASERFSSNSTIIVTITGLRTTAGFRNNYAWIKRSSVRHISVSLKNGKVAVSFDTPGVVTFQSLWDDMLRSINFSLTPLIANIPHMSIRFVPEADVLTLYCVNLRGEGQYY